MLSLMMLLAVFGSGPEPETAIDAERAFNRSAQIDGQWTAFRKFSTPDALMFTPQPVKAHEFLPQKDPPITVQWWPAESYVSCDGTVAVNTGPWVRPRGSGYFTTVWVRQSDGHFKWVYDAGDTLAAPRALPEKPKVRIASCKAFTSFHTSIGLLPGPEGKIGQGQSPDGTLRWQWRVEADGARDFVVHLWNGKDFDMVVHDKVAAPK
jgi:hypothetical protein